jgi:hypothetical protein
MSVPTQQAAACLLLSQETLDELQAVHALDRDHLPDNVLQRALAIIDSLAFHENRIHIYQAARAAERHVSSTSVKLKNQIAIVDALKDSLAEAEADAASLRTTRDTLLADLEQQRKTTDVLLAQIASLPTSSIPVTGAGPAAAIKLPDPPRFDATKSKLLDFISKLRAKLVGDARRFYHDHHQVAYAYGFLEGDAADQLRPYMESSATAPADIDGLIRILERAFGDPDRKGTARRELQKCAQKNRDFSSYYAEFSRIMAVLQLTGEPKLAALRQGLSQELKTLLINHKEPEVLEEFVDLCQFLDSKRLALAQESRPSPAPPRTTSGSIGNRAPMQTTPRVTSTATPTTATGTAPGPMDLSAGQRDAERQRIRNERMARGECLYCGQSGHLRLDCPRRAAMEACRAGLRAAEANTAVVVSPAPTTPSDNVSED